MAYYIRYPVSFFFLKKSKVYVMLTLFIKFEFYISYHYRSCRRRGLFARKLFFCVATQRRSFLFNKLPVYMILDTFTSFLKKKQVFWPKLFVHILTDYSFSIQKFSWFILKSLCYQDLKLFDFPKKFSN